MKTARQFFRLPKGPEWGNWVIALVTVTMQWWIPKSATDSENFTIQLGVLGVALVWAVVYQFLPRDETFEELKRRHRRSVLTTLLVVTVFITVMALDYFSGRRTTAASYIYDPQRRSAAPAAAQPDRK